jgi:hypothetical protein
MNNSISTFSDDELVNEYRRRTTSAKQIADQALLNAQEASQREHDAIQREQAATQREQAAIAANNQTNLELQATTQREQAAQATIATLQKTNAITVSVLDYSALKASDAISVAQEIFYLIPHGLDVTRSEQLRAIGDNLYTFRNKCRPNRLGYFTSLPEKNKAIDNLCKSIFRHLEKTYAFRLTPSEKSRLLEEDPNLLSPQIRKRQRARNNKRSSRLDIVSHGGPYR